METPSEQRENRAITSCSALELWIRKQLEGMTEHHQLLWTWLNSSTYLYH
jgi:hypothetical protein